MAKKKRKKKKLLSWHSGLLIFILILVTFAVLALFPDQKFLFTNGEDKTQDEQSLTATMNCGIMTLSIEDVQFKEYNSVGALRNAMKIAELTSSKQHPLVCQFLCGVKAIPAKNQAELIAFFEGNAFNTTRISTMLCQN